MRGVVATQRNLVGADADHVHAPHYPDHWPVVVLDQAAVDGPDAIVPATLTLVDERRIEIRLGDGELVAVYAPAAEVVFCG